MERIGAWLATLFLASLVTVNLRPAGVSLPLVVGALLIGWMVVDLPTRRRAARPDAPLALLDPFAVVVVLYVFVATLLVAGPDQYFVVAKTTYYTLVFFAFKSALTRSADPLRPLFLGSIIGVVLNWVVLIGGGLYAGIGLADVASFSYDRVTLKIYQALSGLFGQTDEFEGSMVMRTTVGEALALYAIIGFCLRRYGYAALGLVGALVLQSRRAVIAAGVAYVLAHGITVRKIVLTVGALGLALLASVYLFEGNVQNRLSDLDSQGRLDQYSTALRWIADRPWGYGYGAQLEGRYIHNYWLGSYFMGGPVLLFLAGAVTIVMVVRAFDSGPFGLLILVPLLDMAVGSAVEGMLTFNSWAAIATVLALRGRVGGPVVRLASGARQSWTSATQLRSVS